VTPLPRWQYAHGVARDPRTGAPGHGEPAGAERELITRVDPPGPTEALVYVLASEVNFNDIWAITGIPVSPFDAHDGDVQTTGSGGVGLVAALGADARREGRLKVGDLVTIYSGQSELLSPYAARDPMSADFRIQGYETPTGSHAQFLVAQAPQLHPVPPDLGLDAAGSYVLNLGTVVRALFTTLRIEPGRTMLVEGAATGTGLEALKVAARNGVAVVGMVSSAERAAAARAAGAAGTLDRRDPRVAHLFTPVPEGADAIRAWLADGAALEAALREATGGRLADYVVSHAGRPRSRARSSSSPTAAPSPSTARRRATTSPSPASRGVAPPPTRCGPQTPAPARRRSSTTAPAPTPTASSTRPGSSSSRRRPRRDCASASPRTPTRSATSSCRSASATRCAAWCRSRSSRAAAPGSSSGRRRCRRCPTRGATRCASARRCGSSRSARSSRSGRRWAGPPGAGEGRGAPDLVVERAGHDALGVSTSLVQPFTGRVVYAEDMAGRRYSFYAPQVWTRQRSILMPTARILGTHLCNAYEVARMNRMIDAGQLDVTPPLVVDWTELPAAHQAMWDNRHDGATYVCNSRTPVAGLRTRDELYEAWAAGLRRAAPDRSATGAEHAPRATPARARTSHEHARHPGGSVAPPAGGATLRAATARSSRGTTGRRAARADSPDGWRS
jgi:acrylyl-CoA reductase (NADPH)/3-hydroxypropionyl-CoA dehydratase/3-hydroxypropionyl-CoA synthetase